MCGRGQHNVQSDCASASSYYEIAKLKSRIPLHNKQTNKQTKKYTDIIFKKKIKERRGKERTKQSSSIQ